MLRLRDHHPVIALIQRVSAACVTVEGAAVGAIGRGILAFIGVQRSDNEASADRLLERVMGYRVFPDTEGRMNLSVRDIKGELLLVPQFTLAADTRQGTRAGFSAAAAPAAGERLFDYAVARARESGLRVATGRFGAHMQVKLTNDGPVTFWLEVSPH
jgi:D-tyrosyl-tRNA(Tyr) deacylase